MNKTLYSTRISKDENTYWFGDKLLRTVSIIVHTLELALIIYLLVR